MPTRYQRKDPESTNYCEILTGTIDMRKEIEELERSAKVVSSFLFKAKTVPTFRWKYQELRLSEEKCLKLKNSRN